MSYVSFEAVIRGVTLLSIGCSKTTSGGRARSTLSTLAITHDTPSFGTKGEGVIGAINSIGCRYDNRFRSDTGLKTRYQSTIRSLSDRIGSLHTPIPIR